MISCFKVGEEVKMPKETLERHAPHGDHVPPSFTKAEIATMTSPDHMIAKFYN